MSGWAQWLKDKLYAFYRGIVDKVPNPFAGLSSLSEPENKDSVILNALRNKHFDLIAQEAQATAPDYNKVTRIISTDTKTFINQIIAEEQKKLGKAPCEFTMFTLGSLAREETGPITDLEIGFLIKEKNVDTVKYFYQLTQNVSDRLFLLGEHPDIGSVGLHMDGADNAPPHKRFFARYMNYRDAKALMKEAIANRDWDKVPYEGSRPFLATPEEFASFSSLDFKQDARALSRLKDKAFHDEWQKVLRDPKNKNAIKTPQGRAALDRAFRQEMEPWLDEMYRPYNQREVNTANDAGKVLGRNIDFLYGNKKMFDAFLARRETYFSKKEKNGHTARETIAEQCLRGDIKKHLDKGDGILLTGELGEKLDIKRGLYRFAEQFVTNLGFYYHCKKQNTVEIINELVSRKLIHPEWGVKLIDYLQFSTGLRLKEQSKLKRQSEAAYFDQTAFEKDKADLEKKMATCTRVIEFMENSGDKADSIDAQKRKHEKLESNLQHMMEMAPGKIYSAQEVTLIREKYAPLAKQIFDLSQKWMGNKNLLEITSPVSAAQPVLPVKAASVVKPAPAVKPAPLIRAASVPPVRQAASVASLVPIRRTASTTSFVPVRVVTPVNALKEGWSQNKTVAFQYALERNKALHPQKRPSDYEMMQWGKKAGLKGAEMSLYRQMIREARVR